MPSPDRELLTQSAARQLLERAGQIDADSTTVDTLRAAAREAGIADAAFDAALAEMRNKVAAPAAPPSTRALKRVIAAMVAAVLLIGATMMVAIPRAVEESQANLYVDHEVLVECLPMKVAQDIAQTLLNDQGNEVQMSKGSRVLRLRATEAQLKTVQETFASTRRSIGPTCETTPP